MQCARSASSSQYSVDETATDERMICTSLTQVWSNSCAFASLLRLNHLSLKSSRIADIYPGNFLLDCQQVPCLCFRNEKVDDGLEGGRSAASAALIPRVCISRESSSRHRGQGLVRSTLHRLSRLRHWYAKMSCFVDGGIKRNSNATV